MTVDWAVFASTSFFFQGSFFSLLPTACGVAPPKLQIRTSSPKKEELPRTRWKSALPSFLVNCLQMESCSTSEVGGGEGLGAFKGRMEAGTRKLRGDGRDKERKKWTSMRKKKPGRAGGKGQIGGGEPDSKGSAARWMHCFSMRLSWVLNLVRGAQVRHCAVQCSAVQWRGRAAGRRGHTAGSYEKLCV